LYVIKLTQEGTTYSFPFFNKYIMTPHTTATLTPTIILMQG